MVVYAFQKPVLYKTPSLVDSTYKSADYYSEVYIVMNHKWFDGTYKDEHGNECGLLTHANFFASCYLAIKDHLVVSEKTNPEKFDADKAAQFEFTTNSRDEIGMHRVLYVIRRKADDAFVDSNWNQSWIIEVRDSCRKDFLSK